MSSVPGPARNTADELTRLQRSEARLQATEAAIRRILDSDAAIPAPLFMAHMTRELSAAIGADFTFIGELADGSLESIRTVSFFGEGRHQDNFRYSLLHSPCEQVIDAGPCCYPAKAADLFPRDEGLRNLGIEGYIGIPLSDSKNSPLGILVALYRKPVADPQHCMSILQLFASRIAGEVERGRNEEKLKRKSRLERIIADLSSEFIRVPAAELDGAIDRTLGIIGRFAGADRSYIFRFHQDDPYRADNTHEWCRDGIQPFKDEMQNMSLTGDFAWFGHEIRKCENLVLPGLDTLPPSAKGFRRFLEHQDILSLVCVPLVVEERLLGFLGFDFVRTPPSGRRSILPC